MKKFSCILLSIILISSFLTVDADISSKVIPLDVEQSKVEELIPCKATLEDEFFTNRLLLTIKSLYSKVNKVWSLSDFPEISCIENIIDLTFTESQKMYDKRISNSEFSQILCLTLSSATKQEVLDSVAALEENEKILCVEPDYIVEQVSPIDTGNSVSTYANLHLNDFERYKKYTSDTYLLEQEGLFLHNVDKVWNAFTTGSNSVTVGVLDGGVYAHADINSNLITGYDCISQTTGVSSSYADSHGTMVASIIGAVGNNTIGISGVCQDVSIKSFTASHTPDGSTLSTSAMINGILKAAELEIPILNISAGISGENICNAIKEFDGLVICSAGNNQSEITKNGVHYSEAYLYDNVIVVGAITDDKQIYTNASGKGSNYSDTYVHLFALGKNVVGCKKGGGYYLPSERQCGTSYATPYVSGVAALLLSYNNNLTTAQLRQYILEGVSTSSSLTGLCSTGGYLDAYGAFLAMLGDSTHSINLQIMPQMLEVDGNDMFAYEYNFGVTYSENQVKLTEIVIFVGESDLSSNEPNPLFITLSKKNGKPYLDVHLKLRRSPDSLDVPLIEFHFISYSSSASIAKANISVPEQFLYDYLDEPLSPTSDIYRKILIGDVNGDNVVNSNDESLILNHVVGNTTLTGNYLVAADINYDLVINARDTMYLQKYRIGTLLSFY